MARVGNRGRRQETWPLRFWRRGPYPGADREVARPICVRLHPSGRCHDTGICPKSWHNLGRRVRGDAVGTARCRHHLRDRGRSCSGRAEGSAQGRPCCLCRYPHERYPSFPYDLLWEERQLVSVANLTRQDGLDFLRLAPQIGIITKTTLYPLKQANQTLADLRAGRSDGAAVLVP